MSRTEKILEIARLVLEITPPGTIGAPTVELSIGSLSVRALVFHKGALHGLNEVYSVEFYEDNADEQLEKLHTELIRMLNDVKGGEKNE